MKELAIALHGPQGPTGMGYGLEKLSAGIETNGRRSVACGQREGWMNSMYHVIIEQPAFIERCPWNALVPTFELPLREDEKDKLLLPTEFHRLLCLNPFIRKEVRALNPEFPDKCFPLIQQGANPKDFPDVKRKSHSVGTVGKWEPRKGYDLFFSVARHVTHTRGVYAMATSPLHNSEEITELQTLCDFNNVNLLPWEKSQDHVLALLSSLHVAVFASHAEGWNLPLTEALAQGCIVVASDIDAHRWQFNLLQDALGWEEASYRLRLVPTTKTSIIGHDRWYPGVYYVGKKWLSTDIDALATTVQKAIEDTEPPPWTDDHPFPLTWQKAGERIITVVDAAVNKTDG